jgi:hypothetical protein
MVTHRTITILWALLILACASSCSAQQTGQEGADYPPQSIGRATTTVPANTDQSTTMPQSTTNAPTSQQAVSAPAPSSPEAAVQVIRDYYNAINNGEYERAYNYWDRNGAASNQTLEEFREGFAETEHVEVQTGQPGREDAAAGSLFIEIPVSIMATTTDQYTQRYSGTYSLRRVNDVPGATEDQLTWHIYAAYINEISGGG